MALNNLGLGIVISAQDFASGSLRRIAFGVRRLQGGFGDLGLNILRDTRKAGLGVDQLNQVIRRSGRIAAGPTRNAFTQLGATTDQARLAMAKKALMTGRLVAIMKIAAPVVIALGAAFVGLLVINKVTAAFAEFDIRIRETIALIGQTQEETDILTERVLALTDQFGTDKATQAKAFYQTVSAGFTDIGEAAELVTIANKLAIGGVTDVKNAIDALIPTTLAFKNQNLSVQQVSDKLFTTVRLGRTTLNELNSALGTVTPTAAAAGVSIDDMLGSLVTLTRTGLTSSKATTALNAALSAIIKPTKQAKDLANELGIDFSIAALRSKGLTQFLTELKEATGGNVEQLAVLFGRIRALRGVLPLLNVPLKETDGFIRDIANSAGATDDAFNFVSQSTVFMSRRLKSLRETASILLGKAFEPLRRFVLRFGIVMLETFQENFPKIERAINRLVDRIKFFGSSFGFTAREFQNFFVDIAIPGLVTTIDLMTALIPLVALLSEILGVMLVVTRFMVLSVFKLVEAFVKLISLDFEGLMQVFSEFPSLPGRELLTPGAAPTAALTAPVAAAVPATATQLGSLVATAPAPTQSPLGLATGGETTQTINVVLDGEVVAQALARRNKDLRDRGGIASRVRGR